ncbi:MAG: diacylglycerol/lipid kinase family protein, partial [Planctomycetota bacterium]
MTGKPEWNRVLFVWNGKSGKATERAQLDDAIAALARRGLEVEHCEPDTVDDVARAAGEASPRTLIVAAGGDGTVHAVVQGLAVRSGRANGAERPTLGIIPMGTANDFVRSLGIPLDPVEAVAFLERGVTRAVDVVHVSVDGRRQWMIN